jgi:hypothetical protein
MLDDIIEGTVKGVLKGALRFVFEIIVEVLLFYTGEIVIFIITFGIRKPRWNYYSDASASKFVILTEASALASILTGFTFWLVIAWFINAHVLR